MIFSLPDGASAGNDIIMQSGHYFLLNLAVVKMASSENSLKSKHSREGHASDTMTALTQSFNWGLVPDAYL